MPRYSTLALVLIVTALGPAASASAGTKVIPVKIEVTGIASSNNDLAGVLHSKSAKCVKDRHVLLSGDSVDSSQTDAGGNFLFGQSNMYQPGSWKVSVDQSQRFGREGHRKRCGADKASYRYALDELEITFDYSAASGGSGSVMSSHYEVCLPATVSLRKDGSTLAEVPTDFYGNYAFGPEAFEGPGSYKTLVFAGVVADPLASGDFRYVECSGESNEVVVSR
jgi:hypothetical protein